MARWKKGQRCRTTGDTELWSRYRKAMFTRNVNRAKQLRRARIAADLTQVEVARELGISGPAYCYWESGVRNLSNEVVKEAVKAMTRLIREAA